MCERAKIVAALAVFLALATFPFWYTFGAAGDASPPPRDPPKNGSRCIEDKEWMAAHHMELLDQWRNEVVRHGDKTAYTSAAFGGQYKKSLTGTCMTCHSIDQTCDSNSNMSCSKCHDYANVQPRCWDCHLEPKGN